MKSYALPIAVFASFCAIATAQAATKGEIRASFADANELPMLYALQMSLAQPEKGDAAESRRFNSMLSQWKQTCEAKIPVARAAVGSANAGEADADVWARTFVLQQAACDDVSTFITSVIGHVENHPGDSLDTVKKAASVMYQSKQHDFLEAVKKPLLSVRLLSSDWEPTGPVNQAFVQYAPFRVGSKITAGKGTTVVSQVVSGTSTYDLLSLSPDQAKAALDVMALFPAKGIDLQESRSVAGAALNVTTSSRAGEAMELNSVFNWGGQKVMDVVLSKNDFYITGLDVVPLRDPVALVGVSGGGNACSDQRHFLMAKPTVGKFTLAPEFGACDDQVVTLAMQDRAYFKFTSGSGDPHVAVLQKR